MWLIEIVYTNVNWYVTCSRINSGFEGKIWFKSNVLYNTETIYVFLPYEFFFFQSVLLHPLEAALKIYMYSVVYETYSLEIVF